MTASGMARPVRTTVRFYAELNDFVPRDLRAVDIACETERTSVKDLFERLGVPHPEVDLVLVNGESVAFSYLVEDGDRISVFPVFESFDISAVTKVRAAPLRELRFVVDSHLGTLARSLRLLGFDTAYANDWSDAELARISAGERRVLLTRDRGLLKRSAVERGYCVRDDNPERQLAEVVQRFDLGGLARPFARCVRCNGLLEPVAKAAVLDRLEPKTREHYDDFQQCRDCRQVYWAGSHQPSLDELVARALS